MTAISSFGQREGLIKFTFFLAAMGVMAVAFFAHVALTRPGDGIISISGYKCPYYFINYFDYGFIKRGVIASLLYLVPNVEKGVAAFIFNITVLSTLAATVTIILYRVRQKLDTAQWCVLAVLTIFSPLTFAELGYDFGRFDSFNFLILFASLWLLRHDKFYVVAILTSIALLAHEAYLFYGAPLVFLYPWYLLCQTEDDYPGVIADRRWCYFRKMSPIIVIVGFCLGVLLLFGRYEPGVTQLRESMPSFLNDSGALTVWTRPVTANFHHTFRNLSHKSWHSDIRSALVMLFMLGAIIFVMIYAHRISNANLDLLTIAPAGALPLFAFGSDYFRWLSLIWIVALTVLVTKILDGKLLRIGSGNWLNTLCILMLCAIPLGPIGIESPFPLFMSALKLVLHL